MTIRQSLRATTALASLAACTAFLPQVDVRDRPDSGRAYVYGRFAKVVDSATLFSGKGLVLIIKCNDGREHLIDFSEDQPLKMIGLAPSRCALDEFAMTDTFGMPQRKVAIAEIPQTFEVAAGRAYYIGDFRAHLTSDKWNPLVVRSYARQWASDNYQTTTQELKRTYPNFSSLPTENRFKE